MKKHVWIITAILGLLITIQTVSANSQHMNQYLQLVGITELSSAQLAVLEALPPHAFDNLISLTETLNQILGEANTVALFGNDLGLGMQEVSNEQDLRTRVLPQEETSVPQASN